MSILTMSRNKSNKMQVCKVTFVIQQNRGFKASTCSSYIYFWNIIKMVSNTTSDFMAKEKKSYCFPARFSKTLLKVYFGCIMWGVSTTFWFYYWQACLQETWTTPICSLLMLRNSLHQVSAFNIGILAKTSSKYCNISILFEKEIKSFFISSTTLQTCHHRQEEEKNVQMHFCVPDRTFLSCQFLHSTSITGSLI